MADANKHHRRRSSLAKIVEIMDIIDDEKEQVEIENQPGVVTPVQTETQVMSLKQKIMTAVSGAIGLFILVREIVSMIV